MDCSTDMKVLSKVLPQAHSLYAVTLIIFIILVVVLASEQLTGQIVSFCGDVRGAADPRL